MYEAAKKARKASGHDPNALLLAATQAAKRFDMNRHFILKKMLKDSELAERLKFFVENDMG